MKRAVKYIQEHPILATAVGVGVVAGVAGGIVLYQYSKDSKQAGSASSIADASAAVPIKVSKAISTAAIAFEHSGVLRSASNSDGKPTLEREGSVPLHKAFAMVAIPSSTTPGMMVLTQDLFKEAMKDAGFDNPALA